jgi:hypothetical protein
MVRLGSIRSRRTFRLTRRLLGLVREGVHFDKHKKEAYPYRLRVKGLYKYKGRNDVFGSFTEIGTKLGINPRSTSGAYFTSTPFGVYAYPIDFLFRYWNQGLQGFGSEEEWVYGTGMPFLHIFQVSGLDRVLHFWTDDTRLISSWQARYDPIFPYEKQLRNLSGLKELSQGQYELQKDWVVDNITCDQAFAWIFTKQLSKGNRAKWTGLLRQLGLIGAIDHGTATINEVEPEQAVFFDIRSVKELEVVENEFPKQYARPDVKHRQFSEWADDPVKGSLSALKRAVFVANQIKDILKLYNSGDESKVIENNLMELRSIIGWKKTHTTPGSFTYWRESGNDLIREILMVGMNHLKSKDIHPNIKKLIDKIFDMLGDDNNDGKNEQIG